MEKLPADPVSKESAPKGMARLSAALGRVSPDKLEKAVKVISDRYPVRVTSLPTSGLAMLKLRESVNGDAFNLGEIPLSTATVELDLGDGQTALGGANVMADDADLAVWVAICDAVLVNNLSGSETLVGLLEEGLAELQRDQDIRQSIMDRTRVRFSLLNEDDSAKAVAQ
jgi:alpha-D-ribose 1-methylphosphonate 5-triphosphate synthase subunit PhnG